ncbi:MAG: hypothetical protein EVA89_14650 [Sandaracinaceae bacterium]|nr:MAG: hypothetical protein EVA89_14650 [Sandaracinaceae bacterium]
MAAPPLVTASLALLTACATTNAAGGETAEAVSFARERPSQIDFELDFDRRHFAVQRSSVCAEPAPLHAVLVDTSPLGNVFLGFCDGAMVSRDRRGGLSGNLQFLRLAQTTDTRGFGLDGQWVRTQIPAHAELEIRPEPGGESVRLVGKGVDLCIRRAPPSDGGELSAEGCPEIERGPGYVICRQAGGYRVRAHVEVAGRRLLVESEPRMRATLRQAQEMIRAAQLMH